MGKSFLSASALQKIGSSGAKPAENKRGAFTLVELIAVIAILAVLLAAVTPKASELIRGARRSAAEAEAHITAQAVQRYLDRAREEGELNARTLHRLMGAQLDDPEGMLADYVSGGLPGARILSADVNLRTGQLEELQYENENTVVKLVIEEDGTVRTDAVTDKPPAESFGKGREGE